jgi:hypothetical protein
MTTSIARVLMLALVLLAGAVLMVAPAGAKSNCGKDCRKQILTEFKSCRASCPKGMAGKACRKACSLEHKSDLTSCRSAVNPTPPQCGDEEGSPSGAFLDRSLL